MVQLIVVAQTTGITMGANGWPHALLLAFAGVHALPSEAAAARPHPHARAPHRRAKIDAVSARARIAAIDERIFAAWDGHPRRRVVEAMPDFLTKAKRALELIREALPPCCQHPSEPEIGR